MADATKNFGIVEVSQGYDNAATTVALSSGQGSKLPAVTGGGGPELLLNGNLESWVDANNPTSWTVGKAGTGSVDRSTDSHAGTYAAALTSGGGFENFSNMEQSVSTTASSKAHTLTYWAKGTGLNAYIVIKSTIDGAQNYYDFVALSWVVNAGPPTGDQIKTQALTGTYTQYTAQFTSSSGVVTNITPIVSALDIGTIYMDDISLKQDIADTSGAYNLTWWNSTDYTNPADDPNVEIIRCVTRSTDTLYILRGQESTSAATHNTGGKTYKMSLGVTAKTIDDKLDIVSERSGQYGGAMNYTSPGIQANTMNGAYHVNMTMTTADTSAGGLSAFIVTIDSLAGQPANPNGITLMGNSADVQFGGAVVGINTPVYIESRNVNTDAAAHIILDAADAWSGTNGNGKDVILQPGEKDGNGRPGRVIINKQVDANNLLTEEYSGTINDNGTISLPGSVTGMLDVWEDVEYARWYIKFDGSVNDIYHSTNSTNADVDNCLCVYDGGSNAIIKNTLGAPKVIRYVFKFS